jgi:CheY-like chemotaxis protein
MNNLILVVEDSEDYRFILRTVLESGGFKVDLVTNGVEALRYLRTGKTPNLMFVDLNMPIMDGAEFCAIRDRESDLRAIPVLLFSNDPYAARIAQDIHANGAIPKCTSPINILKEVRRFLN